MAGAKEFSEHVSRELGADVVLEESAELLRLWKVVVPESKRGFGVGSRALARIKAYADGVGKDVILNALPLEPGMQARLNRFYERNGFQRAGEDPFNRTPYYLYKAKRSGAGVRRQASRGLPAITSPQAR